MVNGGCVQWRVAQRDVTIRARCLNDMMFRLPFYCDPEKYFWMYTCKENNDILGSCSSSTLSTCHRVFDTCCIIDISVHIASVSKSYAAWSCNCIHQGHLRCGNHASTFKPRNGYISKLHLNMLLTLLLLPVDPTQDVYYKGQLRYDVYWLMVDFCQGS